MPADHNAFGIRRRRRQAAIEVDRNNINIRFQSSWEFSIYDHLAFNTRRQSILLGKPRGKVPGICIVPGANFVAIVFGKAISTPVFIVVVVVLALISPVASVVAFITVPILIVIVTVGESQAA